MNNLIKIANFLESIQMYKASDRFIRVAQFQPVKPSELSGRSEDTILTETGNEAEHENRPPFTVIQYIMFIQN